MSGEKKQAFKVMKVFDCQYDPGMPDDVKMAFFSFYECGNDTYVEWTVQSVAPDADVDRAQRKAIDDWLIDHGALGSRDDDHEGETVLIKHWW